MTMFRPLLVALLCLSALPIPFRAAAGQSQPKKNGDVARLAGLALHLSQDAQALERASVKRREKLYGRSDPQARAGRLRLRRIHHKVSYFRHVKRRSEGG